MTQFIYSHNYCTHYTALNVIYTVKQYSHGEKLVQRAVGMKELRMNAMPC